MDSHNQGSAAAASERRVLVEKAASCLQSLDGYIRRLQTPDGVRAESSTRSTLENLQWVREQLLEAWTDSDWSRFGAVVGLLWYRLDKMIGELGNIRRGIEKLER